MLYEVITSTIDLIPTIAHYSKSDLPQKQLDGLDIHEHLENTSSLLPERSYLYSSGKTRITSYNVCYTKLLRVALALLPAPDEQDAHLVGAVGELDGVVTGAVVGQGRIVALLPRAVGP